MRARRDEPPIGFEERPVPVGGHAARVGAGRELPDPPGLALVGPDATVALDFALHRLSSVMENLLVYPENMQANLDQLGGLVHSQQVLLALTQKGASREEAYKMVQRNAMQIWADGGSYLDKLKADADVAKYLSPDDLEALFDLDQHFQHVDTIFKRVFT